MMIKSKSQIACISTSGPLEYARGAVEIEARSCDSHADHMRSAVFEMTRCGEPKYMLAVALRWVSKILSMGRRTTGIVVLSDGARTGKILRIEKGVPGSQELQGGRERIVHSNELRQR